MNRWASFPRFAAISDILQQSLNLHAGTERLAFSLIEPTSQLKKPKNFVKYIPVKYKKPRFIGGIKRGSGGKCSVRVRVFGIPEEPKKCTTTYVVPTSTVKLLYLHCYYLTL